MGAGSKMPLCVVVIFERRLSSCPTGGKNAGLFYENFLRYLALAVRNQYGAHSASCLLDHIKAPDWVKDGGSAKVGVDNEVKVYDVLEEKYNLIPTLDNGFHFDFIGTDSGQVVLIDATPLFIANTSVFATGVFGSITAPFSTNKAVCKDWFILELPSNSRRTIKVSNTTIFN